MRIALIHATPLSMPPIDDAFDRLWPEAQRMHLLDDSLSRDRARDGELTPAMVQRFIDLATYAKGTGAEGILFTCSAFGPAIEAARKAVGIPTLKPNEAMFEEALKIGGKLGLVATFEPSVASMSQELRALNPAVDLQVLHVPEAMSDLAAGRVDEHHRKIAQAAAALGGCDVVMLAQFSMAASGPLVQARVPGKVLTSPDCAVQALKRAF